MAVYPEGLQSDRRFTGAHTHSTHGPRLLLLLRNLIEFQSIEEAGYIALQPISTGAAKPKAPPQAS